MKNLSALQLALLTGKAARMGITLDELLDRIEDEAETLELQRNYTLQREVLTREAWSHGRWIVWRSA